MLELTLSATHAHSFLVPLSFMVLPLIRTNFSFQPHALSGHVSKLGKDFDQ